MTTKEKLEDLEKRVHRLEVLTGVTKRMEDEAAIDKDLSDYGDYYAPLND